MAMTYKSDWIVMALNESHKNVCILSNDKDYISADIVLVRYTIHTFMHFTDVHTFNTAFV